MFVAVPVVELTATGTAAKNVRVLWWATAAGHTTPQASLGEWQWWACERRLAEIQIDELPAGWTLKIDGRARTVKVTNGATTADGSRLVRGYLGRPWVWPNFDGPYVVAVESDTANPIATALVQSAARELTQ